jgi:hypothetical protein
VGVASLRVGGIRYSPIPRACALGQDLKVVPMQVHRMDVGVVVTEDNPRRFGILKVQNVAGTGVAVVTAGCMSEHWVTSSVSYIKYEGAILLKVHLRA